jgi:DNA repair exonuclease SbcCD ATPase subunit
MAERKRRASERDARRESLLVLLSRTRRGVALTPSEAALMFAHVEVELAEADELRRTVAGQQTAIQREQSRTAAAEAAIVEAEAEAEEHKAEHLAACEQIAAMHAAAVGEVRGPLLGVVEDVASMRAAYEAQHARADTLDRLCREQRQRAEQAEERLAAYVDIFGPEAPDDFHTMQHRAKQAEAALDRMRALARRMRAGSPQGAAAIYADRIEQTLDEAPGALTDEQAAAHAAFAEAADSTRAQLAEQAREHAIALATEHRRGDGWKRHALDADHKADRYRLAWLACRRDRRADRAAMAAELPDVIAGQQARAARDHH